MPKKGRSSEAIQRRNEALITRYYYWSVIWQRRHDKVLETLEKEEFFLSPFTIDVILRQDDNLFSGLSQARPSIKQLQEQFPAFHFEDNPYFWKK